MRVLLVTVGIGGDQVPFVAWGRILASQGHDVTLLGNGAYAHLAENAELRFVSVISAEEHERRTRVRQQSSGIRLVRNGVENLLVDAESVHREMAPRLQPGNTIVVANVLAMGARLVQEQHQVPTITIVISPTVFRSPHDPASWPEWLPRPLHSWASRLMTRAANRRMKPAINRLRAEIGMDPIQGAVREWLYSPQRVISMFPPWFLPPQPDWPPETKATCFPLPNIDDTPPLPASLEKFLAEGEAPVIFSHTSGLQAAVDFYEQALPLAAMLGRRVVILAADTVPLPERLPPNVIRLPFAAHRRLLPRSALAVHHGGVQTAAAAFDAGIPQFVVPAILDHPENARRIKGLGVGDYATPRDFRAEKVAGQIRALLDSPAVKARCEHFAKLSAEQRPFKEETELLMQLANRTLAPQGPSTLSELGEVS